MELRQLDFFVAVAEEASFTHGARRLHAAQSAASAAVARLERELRQPLFVRGTRPLQLTEAGNILLGRAQALQEHTHETLAELAELRDGIAGTLAIGTVLSFGSDLLPDALKVFHHRFPRVKIQLMLSAGPIDEHLEKVRSGEFDVALVPSAARVPAEVTARTVELIRLGLACPPGHPLARAHAVRYQDIVGETFIDFPADWGNRALVEELFAREHCTRTVAIEVSNVGAALTLVAGGLGLSFVPIEFLHSRADVAAVDLRRPPPSIPIAAAIRSGHCASAAARALYRLLVREG